MTFQAILFDCDGVLVDSESITCGVLRDMFEEQGWRMSLADCMQRVVGHTFRRKREIEGAGGLHLQAFQVASECADAGRGGCGQLPQFDLVWRAGPGRDAGRTR
jgi:beta-phosphoglucomutase-like phosphatase (HAD superfamily)